MNTQRERFAIIAGSGMATFGSDAPGRHVTTRFGAPSGPVHELNFEGHSVLTLARHGPGHTLPPHAVNYRANLVALQMLGATRVIALNTVGVIDGNGELGQLAVPDQLIDYTWGRDHSIHDGHCATLQHVELTEPFTQSLRQALLDAAAAAAVPCDDGGTYGVTQGPRLETRAEVDRLERDGVTLVGMTAMPEAGIARELGLDYACLSMLVNFAAGRGSQGIHDDIEATTMSAKMQAMHVLKAFFAERGH